MISYYCILYIQHHRGRPPHSNIWVFGMVDTYQALNNRLESGSKTLVAQDFQHVSQKEHESVSDFICHLKKTFQLAYGHDSMTLETRHTLLHSQLQEGLRQEIMSGLAVSVAET